MDQQSETERDPKKRLPNNELGGRRDYLFDTTITELLVASSPHQRSALGLLAISYCSNLPLAPMLGRLGGESSGAFSRQVKYFAAKVHAGEDPVKVVQELDHVLTPSIALALRVAHDNGSLPKLYQAVMRRTPEYESDADTDREINSRISRLMTRGFFVLMVLLFSAVRVFPEFQKMFEEFGIELPTVMERFFVAISLISKFGFLVILLLIPLGFWLGRRYLRQWNPVAWRKKVIPKAALRRQSLAIVTQKDASEVGLAPTMSSFSVRQRFFPKLAKESTQIDGGQAAWGSLASQGMISNREAKTLASAHSGETQAWLLRWSANSIGERKKLKSHWCINAVIWLGNILLAGIVFWFAVMTLSFLITIMESLA